MDIKLLFHLSTGIFSLNRNNMRFFNAKRIAVVILILPVFVLLFINHKLFLYLDYALFPSFRKQKIRKPVFIVAAPRSGTTYLYHSLAKNPHFTCFKLWEIAFAPSITQKYIALAIMRADSMLRNPLKKTALWIENLFICKLKTIHLIGLNLPEEDEGLLLWDLTSNYLNFFYPDSNIFNDYLLFDDNLDQAWRLKIMKSYRNYLLRHNYVFNRNGTKQFLSKNPLMMCKLNTIHAVFPDALILNINRCPAESIPSTIALNNTLYSLFTSNVADDSLNERTKSILVEWYRMSNQVLESKFYSQHLKISFYGLIMRNPETEGTICRFLDIPHAHFLMNIEHQKAHKSKNRYTALTRTELKSILRKIPHMEPFTNQPV